MRIPFTNPLPKDKQDKTMRDKLRAPEVQQAVLAWAVEGCLAWQRDGLGTCASIEESTKAYRKEMDRAEGFFEDCCEFGSSYQVGTPELRRAYERWCNENKKSALSGKELAKKLRARECCDDRSGTSRWWNGVRLIDGDDRKSSDEGGQDSYRHSDFVGGR